MSEEAPTGGSSLPIDAKRFWRTLGERAIGVTIVTAAGTAGPAGFLALSAAHVSADPPTLLVSIDRRTAALAAVLESRHFAVNILGRAHAAVSDAFAGKDEAKGRDRFAPGQWSSLSTGAPIFRGGLAAFDCALEETVERPGTVIAIGRVIDCFARGEGEPLLFFRGTYR